MLVTIHVHTGINTHTNTYFNVKGVSRLSIIVNQFLLVLRDNDYKIFRFEANFD